MQEAVIAVSADGRVLWANHRMNRIATNGVRLNAPLIETSRNPDFLRVVSEALENGGVRTARVSSSSVGRTFDATVAPMQGGGAVVVLYDITKTERIEKTRRDFIANVSHELRTPLTSIQGYAETLLDTVPDGAQERDFIEIIRKNAARMARLTEDLLILARVESREQRFEFRSVAPAALLQDAYESFREVARAAGIEIEIENTATGNASADPDAIHQVFANLIDNAIKYGATGLRVIIGARPAADEDEIEFYVRDFGPGIASEHLPRLFERFYRVDKARSRESGGTGLGLAIVKHIVLAHHGNIRAESQLNHGSTFFFTLPVARAEIHATSHVNAS
jgi:two-component system phosphate regulon sensor histidine kinase PhoR